MTSHGRNITHITVSLFKIEVEYALCILTCEGIDMGWEDSMSFSCLHLILFDFMIQMYILTTSS
jgi:hypothetical protein